jgi:mannose-6-phosphate isomerase-like protein (cupin superfamily)
VAFFVNLDKAPTKEMSWGRGRSFQLVSADTGSNRVDFHVNVLKPGSGHGPYHYHSNSENIYFILEGRARILIEGKETEAGAGACVWIPPGEKHDVVNVGETDLRLIEVKAPADSDFIMLPHPQVPGGGRLDR